MVKGTTSFQTRCPSTLDGSITSYHLFMGIGSPGGGYFFKEALIQSARAVSKRFFTRRRFQKRRNTVCTRKGYAASVSQLALATAALYFPLWKPHGWGKRSAHSRRRFIQRFLDIQQKENRRTASPNSTAFSFEGLVIGRLTLMKEYHTHSKF